MTSYPGPYPSSSRTAVSKPVGITEFEILKASHKFLRDEDEKPTTWDEKLAGKYYSNLYREFAVCDLKHYKSGNFALRWRTEEEVLSGAGETTCGNTRCEHHFAPPSRSQYTNNADNEDTSPVVPLTTLELPFVYAEHGETKSALVKVVLCNACVRKLMYKRTKEKGKERERGAEKGDENGKQKDRGKEKASSEMRREKRGRESDAAGTDARRPKRTRAVDFFDDDSADADRVSSMRRSEDRGEEPENKRYRSKKRSRSRSRSRSRERSMDARSSRRRSKSPRVRVKLEDDA